MHNGARARPHAQKRRADNVLQHAGREDHDRCPHVQSSACFVTCSASQPVERRRIVPGARQARRNDTAHDAVVLCGDEGRLDRSGRFDRVSLRGRQQGQAREWTASLEAARNPAREGLALAGMWRPEL